MKHNKLIMQVGAALAAFTAPVAVLAVSPFDTAKDLVTKTQSTAGLGTSTTTLPDIIGRIINAVLGFLGILLLAYLLYAGFLWMTAGGDEDKVKTATTMIKNAVIGLLIIVAAFSISNFVLQSLINVAAP